MAVQVRRGPYSDFNANKLVPGEWAAVTSGDPNASDGCATYMCFAPGNVKRMATYEDMAENINAATSEIQGNFSAEMNAAMGAANAAAASAQSAAAEAETAKESANTAAANANTAAEAANAAANGDVSGKTVTFQEATERANVQSGDSLEVAFGKLAKFCADLKDYAFEDTVKNLTTGEQGKALDATMGKALDEKIGNLNDLTTTSKDSVVDAVDELNMNMKHYKSFADIELDNQINWDDILIKLPNQSEITVAIFSSDYQNLTNPGTGTKRVITVTRAYSGYVTIKDWDVDNNIIYYRTQYGSNYTAWKQIG